MAVVIGQNFGNFQVVRLIGEGGFGEVYEAENPLIQRRVAIKVLHTDMAQHAELVRRFLNEARAASAIRHPNIIEVFDAGVTQEGEPYILMEFLDGDSLQKYLLEHGRAPLRTVQEIARQAGAALSAAHAAGIVHRDLKPENLFLVPDASASMGFCVKVLDFGIAKVQRREDKPESTVRTQVGLLMGSPSYMSPEQCRDSSEVDHRSDIYSLAIIVYEMLVGVPPFACKSATEMLVLQITADPAPLRQHVPEVPEYVEQAVMRALSKDRTLRYDSVDYFVGALLGSYPALTSPGAARTEGSEVGVLPEESSLLLGDLPSTPAPAPLGNIGGVFASALGMTPAPVALSSPTITTLSHATGEAETAGSLDDGETFELAVRPRRWPVVAGFAAVVAGSVLLLLMHRQGPASSSGPATPSQVALPSVAAAPPASIVHVHIESSPAGATVVNEADGTSLGQTPLEVVYAQAEQAHSFLLRLDGYYDKSIEVSLDGNSSTSADLERILPVAGSLEKVTVPVPLPDRKRISVARKTPKPSLNQDREDEWRVH